MKVRDIMSKDFVSLSPEDTISRFVSLAEKEKINDIILTQNKKLVGIAYLKDIAKRGVTDPSKAKLSTIMSLHSFYMSPEQNLDEAADIIFKTGLRMLPVVEKNKVVGAVYAFDILQELAKLKEFRQTKAESIMSTPETVDLDTDIGKARVLLRERHYEMLPVVDKNGNLIGCVSIFNLAQSLRPRERIGWYSMAAEKETIMKTPVSTILSKDYTTTSKDATLSELANLMSKNRVHEVIITEGNVPVGIVTTKDLLEMYISRFKQKGIYYQITGLTDEDEFILDNVYSTIEDSIQKISKVFKPYYFFVHVKKHDKGGGRSKYSIRTRLRTEKGTFISKAFAWDLRDAVKDAMNRLERLVMNIKKEKAERARKMKIKFKRIFK